MKKTDDMNEVVELIPPLPEEPETGKAAVAARKILTFRDLFTLCRGPLEEEVGRNYAFKDPHGQIKSDKRGEIKTQEEIFKANYFSFFQNF